jgi:hypothetical protein
MNDRVAKADFRLGRLLVISVALIAGVNLLVFLVRQVMEGEAVDGPAGSSYVTTASGVGAMFEMYEQLGLHPVRLRDSFLREPMQVDQVLFQMNETTVSVEEEVEARAVRDFVTGGGRLILAGPVSEGYLRVLSEDYPVYALEDGIGPVEQVFSDLPASGVATIESDTIGVIAEPRTWTPLYVDDQGRVLVVVSGLGSGEVYWIADYTFFANSHIALADNASLAVALADGRQPVFDETIHGFFNNAGLIPQQWLLAFWLGLAAALVAVVSYGTRRVPPEEFKRDLAPARAQYVDSMGSLLARAKDESAALKPIREAAMALLTTASGEPDGQTRLAMMLGLAPHEVSSLLDDDSPDPVVMGQAFAKLELALKERL